MSEEMGVRKREVLESLQAEQLMRSELRKWQKARERECRRTKPKGHVYVVRGDWLECAGCGKTRGK